MIVQQVLVPLGRSRCHIYTLNKAFSSSISSLSNKDVRSTIAKKQYDQKSKQGLLQIDSPTFDGKWILPSYIYLPKKHSSDNHSKEKGPILLICGWAGAGKCDWGAVPKILASKTRRHVITFDARGIGNSRRNDTDLIQGVDGTDGNDIGEEEFTMESMALDAIAIIKKYYETMSRPAENRKSELVGQSDDVSDNSAYATMDFCVGGASMGGMVAQYILGLTTSSSKTRCGLQLDSFRVTSMGLICTSVARRIPRNESSELANILEENHFLRSFDAWPSSEHDDSNHDQLYLKEQCISCFFQAMGSKFLSKPGRKALQIKLMKAFIETRKSFENKDNYGILQQRRALLRHFSHGLEVDILDNIVAENNHFLDIVKTNKIPFVIVHGEDDSVIPLNHARHMYSLLVEDKSEHDNQDDRPSELFVLRECDHLCWITHGLEVVDILGDFWCVKTVST